MTEELKKTITEELEQLPKEGQDAIKTIDWVRVAEEIGITHELDEEEIGDFQLETLLVLIGAADAEFYAVNIENHVETTKETAEKMADEAFQQIFAPIRKILEENIKKSIQDKNLDHAQNLNFILSGGNYAALLANTPQSKEKPVVVKKEVVSANPSNVKKIQDIKSKFVI